MYGNDDIAVIAFIAYLVIWAVGIGIAEAIMKTELMVVELSLGSKLWSPKCINN